MNSKDTYIKMLSALIASNRYMICYNLTSSVMKILIEDLAAIGVTIVKLMKPFGRVLVRNNWCPVVEAAKIMEFANSYWKPSTCTVMRAMKIFDKNFKMSQFLEPGDRTPRKNIQHWRIKYTSAVRFYIFCKAPVQRE